MSQFLSPLVVEDSDGFPFILFADLEYQSDLLGKVLTIKKGFKTDYASIPRPVWSILPPVGKYDKAAVVHDFLYRTNGVTRKQADDTMLEAMKVLGVGWWTRTAIHTALRIGGSKAWNKYRKLDGTTNPPSS